MLLLTAVFGEGAPDVTVNFVSISTFYHNHLKCDETSDLNSDPDMQTLRNKPVVGSEDRRRSCSVLGATAGPALTWEVLPEAPGLRGRRLDKNWQTVSAAVT